MHKKITALDLAAGNIKRVSIYTIRLSQIVVVNGQWNTNNPCNFLEVIRRSESESISNLYYNRVLISGEMQVCSLSKRAVEMVGPLGYIHRGFVTEHKESRKFKIVQI